MATIYRSLTTAVLLLWGYLISTGLDAGTSKEALSLHLRVGLVGGLIGGAVQSVPFAYFLGTHFWIKAFARASRAGEDWEQRHRLWMKGGAYIAMYTAPFLTMGVAIAGSMVETGRIPHAVHPLLVVAAAIAQIAALVLVPRAMERNSALMDQLADEHQVPKPESPEMEDLIAEEEALSLPALFQMSRWLLLFSVQILLLWLYLRYGTEGFRETPAWPFAAISCVLLTLGKG
ncbi:MAG: hypothetical protein ACI9EF_003096, partial [Pseudohongiellaceae bacterium]